MVDHIDAGEEAVQLVPLGDIRSNPQCTPSPLRSGGTPRDCHHLVLVREERQKRASDEAARPENGDLHGRLSRTSRAT